MSTNSTGNTVAAVTIERVVSAMREHSTELVPDASGRAAHANINGFEVMFVILDSVMIVRTASATDTPADSPDATLYLAANQVNSVMLGARSIVVNREEKLALRTEAEIQVAAGLSDAQLSSALRRAVDAILGAQDALTVTAEEFAQLRDSVAGEPE